jgi:hypothetical protein
MRWIRCQAARRRRHGRHGHRINNRIIASSDNVAGGSRWETSAADRRQGKLFCSTPSRARPRPWIVRGFDGRLAPPSNGAVTYLPVNSPEDQVRARRSCLPSCRQSRLAGIFAEDTIGQATAVTVKNAGLPARSRS